MWYIKIKYIRGTSAEFLEWVLVWKQRNFFILMQNSEQTHSERDCKLLLFIY